MKYREFKTKIRPLPVFSTGMLNALTEDVNTLKVQLSLWKKQGLVRALRRGLYVLPSEERQVEPPAFYLANQIFLPSYVSLETALAYYGLIPEFVFATTSVTVRKTCRFENDFGVFVYQHVRPECFFGFDSLKLPNGLSALVGSPEKAVVDFLYLNLSKFGPSDRKIFKESYRFQNGDILEPGKLKSFAQKMKCKKLLSVVNLFIEEVCRERFDSKRIS